VPGLSDHAVDTTGPGRRQPGWRQTSLTRLALSRHATLLDALCLACVPGFAALFTRMNLGPSGVDPWLYFGYGTNFTSLLARFGWTYFAARLPWNLTTHLYFAVFTPQVGLFLLATTVSCLGSISLYSILRTYYGRPAAFIAAFALQANAWYLGHSFWLYVDSPAMSLSLLSIALFLRGVRRDAAWAIALAGAVSAIGANVHPMVAVLVLPALGLMVLLERPIRVRRILGWGLLFGGAAALAVIALCSIAWLAFGNFWFFMTTVETVQWMVAASYWRNYQVPFAVWADDATALSLPVGVLCVGALLTARDAIRRRLRPDLWIFLYAGVLGAFMLVIDGVFGMAFNQTSFYFIYLWVPMFLLLGLVIDRLLAGSAAARPFAVIGTVAVSLATLNAAGVYWRLYPTHPLRLSFMAYGVLAALLLASLVGAWFAETAKGGVIRALAAMSLVSFVTLAAAADHRVVATAHVEPFPVIWFNQTTTLDLQATVDAQHFIENNADPARGLMFWYDRAAPAAQEFMAICATFRYWFLNEAMPSLPSTALLATPADIVLLSSDEAQLRQATEVLRDRGFFEEIRAQTIVGRGARPVLLWIVATRSAAEAARVAGEIPSVGK
jgi:hypothetical protein